MCELVIYLFDEFDYVVGIDCEIDCVFGIEFLVQMGGCFDVEFVFGVIDYQLCFGICIGIVGDVY